MYRGIHHGSLVDTSPCTVHLPEQQDRRALAMGLHPRPQTQGRGLRTPLRILRARSGSICRCGLQSGDIEFHHRAPLRRRVWIAAIKIAHQFT